MNQGYLKCYQKMGLRVKIDVCSSELHTTQTYEKKHSLLYKTNSFLSKFIMCQKYEIIQYNIISFNDHYNTS